MLTRSEKGSVLLLVLAFAVVVGIVAFGVQQRIQGALSTQKNRILRNQYIDLTESIRRQLEDPQLCPTLIGGQAVNTGQLTTINTSFGSINTQPITSGWLSNPGGVRINSIQIRDLTFVKNIYMANDGATYQVFRGNIFLDASNVLINITGSGGRSDLMIEMLFMVQSNQIRGCFGVTSQGGQCIAMGGGYDWRPGTSGYTYPQHRCHPQSVCRYTSNGTFSAADANAANNICRQPFRATSVGMFMDTGQGRFFCQWCNSHYHD